MRFFAYYSFKKTNGSCKVIKFYRGFYQAQRAMSSSDLIICD